jgi:microsomal dipeptidase-like Zn-dependent dipeptidase
VADGALPGALGELDLVPSEGPGGEPGVTLELLHSGGVGVALSVLYTPFTEIDLDLPYGSPPRPGYLESVLAQMKRVEESVANHDEVVCPVTRRDQLDWAVEPDSSRLALIHCVEGGHVLRASKAEIKTNVAKLADKGVAYVTIAHLFWRRVATNSPALPFLPDRLYGWLFRQPKAEGLSELGKVAVTEMRAKRILVDLTHMSGVSITQTLDLLDELDDSPGETPVIASHGACRFPNRPRFRQLQYNLSDETIRRVANRGGVIGLIACKHYISRGLRPLRVTNFRDSVKLLCAHIDRIGRVTDSLDHVAIGTDLDGFIKPALPGLTHMGRMDELQTALRDRYDSTDADKICNRNALRVLRYRFQ